jgi:hypothetical protein
MMPVFIPSRGRYGGSAKAIALCVESGADVTVFVEPQEADAYAAAYPKAKLCVLPLAGQGIVYVRQYMLNTARANGWDYYWQVDDNIKRFVEYQMVDGAKRVRPAAFTEAAEWIEQHAKQVPRLALAAFAYCNLIAYYSAKMWQLNKLTTCALLTNTRTGIDYMAGADCREDFEFCIHHLTAGWTTFLCQRFAMEKPPSAGLKNVGGLAEAYKARQSERASQLIHARYPRITKLVPWKGVFSQRSLIDGMLDVRLIDWKMFSQG